MNKCICTIFVTAWIGMTVVACLGTCGYNGWDDCGHYGQNNPYTAMSLLSISFDWTCFQEPGKPVFSRTFVSFRKKLVY